MASKLIVALAAIAVVSASPVPEDIRSARFCSSWSPLGTDYLSDEAPYDFICRPSSDGRTLTMRIIGKTAEDTYTYLMMAAVDRSGNGMTEGEHKVDNRLRTLQCNDKSSRVLKISEDKINDIIATYNLPEDKEITLEDVNCRFVVATSLTTYYRDVTVSPLGEKVETDETPVETVDEPVETVDEPVETVDEPVETVDERVETVDETEINEQVVDDFNSTEAVNTTETEFVQTTTETIVQETDETVEPTDRLDEFEPSNTVDETQNLENQFDNEEKVGHETPVVENKDETVVVAAPDVPEETDEFKNEGKEDEEEPEYMIDEFGIKRMIIPEKEKKLIYKGTSTGYWCEDMGNTYVMAPGTDCRMFYQTIMKDGGSAEVLPLAAFNCAPGTRFNTFKCTCSQYDGLVCPDANPDFKTTTLKPQVAPVFNETAAADEDF